MDFVSAGYICKSSVFVKTNKGLSRLKPGDKVLYGKLSRIDWENQEAIFKLNKHGISENISLTALYL